MRKRVLITGGAGFIGANLALKLIASGYQVWVLDNLHSQIHGETPKTTSSTLKLIQGKVEFIKGDVTKKEDWKKVINKVDAIIHLAAETGTGQSMTEIERYSAVNIGGTSIMLEMLSKEKHTVKKIILASSRAIYGEGKYFIAKLNKYVYPYARSAKNMSNGDFKVKIPDFNGDLKPYKTDENAELRPNSFYGITKQFQEQSIMTICPNLGIAAVSLRFQNVYGPGQSLNNPYTGVLSYFSSQIIAEKSVNIFEDGKESRDFVYIDDVVEAVFLALESPISNGQIYNVGTGTATSIYAVAGKLKKLLPQKNAQLKISGDFRVGDIRHNFADISKISRDLGFIPKIDIDEGLKRYVEWVKKETKKTALVSLHSTAIMPRKKLEEATQLIEQARYHLFKISNPQLKQLAITFYQRALEINPNDEKILLEMAKAWYIFGNTEKALGLCELVLQNNNDSLLGLIQKCVFQISSIEQPQAPYDKQLKLFEEELKTLLLKVKKFSPQRLLDTAEVFNKIEAPWIYFGNQNLLKLQRTWGELVHHIYSHTYKSICKNPTLKKGEKIRVGFVSPNFRFHSDYKMLLRGWISQIDKNQFEIYAYSLKDVRDAYTDEIEQYCYQFKMGKHSVEEWRSIISNDNLDALIYSEVGLNNLTMPLAGVRLAPVQCTTWGNPITSGLRTMDYFFGSELAESPEADKHYSEKLVRLPFISTHFKPLTKEVPDISRKEFGLDKDDIVFLCAQPFMKYQMNMDKVFARIATGVAKSKFIFFNASFPKSVENIFRKRLTNHFSKVGIVFEEKVVILPRQNPSRFQAIARICDIFLDSFGFSGGTSTMETAVCNGLPIVTRPGSYMRGRQSLGILRGLGIQETIAADFEEYIQIAVRLGLDSQWRNSVSKKINDRKHLVFEDQKCILGLEKFLSFAVERAVKNQPPASWPVR